MKTLYLHIGMPKTATSSIQKFLGDNRDTLEKCGYCYPESMHRYPYVSFNRNAHFMIARIFETDGTRAKELEKAHWKDGFAQITDCFEHFDHVILSDEGIWKASQYSHQKLFLNIKKHAKKHGYQMKIIVYLRRQDQFLLSRWNQSVKHSASNPLTWEEYQTRVLKKENYILDYAGALDKIAAVIGKENIIVRKFAKESWVNQSIIDDFMSCIGLEVTDEFKPLEQNSNLSLEGNTAEIKRILNSSDAFSQEDRLYLGSFLRNESSESGQRYPCCMMSPEEIRKFLQTYEEGNARVASEYIGDHAPLFSEEIRDLPKWQPDNPYMTADVICFFSSVALELRRENENLRRELCRESEELHRETERQRRENEKLRQEIRELRTQLKDTKADLRTFKNKLHHPFRTLWNLLFHRNKK